MTRLIKNGLIFVVVVFTILEEEFMISAFENGVIVIFSESCFHHVLPTLFTPKSRVLSHSDGLNIL